jgi:radical SAM superfamily enzyme YgiQ (UPF0313 family)
VESDKNGSKEVLLVFPGQYRAQNPQVPLSLVHVASPLRRAGYNVRILDMRVEDARGFRISNPVFVGISSMSGLQIAYGLEFARKARSEKPLCPIVWGGVHPSLLPEQTAGNKYVDVAVRGEAEPIVVELAKRLQNDDTLDQVPGITYKHRGKIRSTPDAEQTDPNQIPIDLPYDLLHMEKYPSFREGRFHIQTSRGCPHGCGFCYNSVFNKNKWRAKSSERVLDEIEHILSRFPHVKCIDPIDDNFFVDKKRVEDICRGLIERQIAITWRANCRFDYMSRYDRSFISLLQESGCVELDFGAETGSDRLLSFIGKGVTPDQMIKTVDNLKKWAPSIEPYVSWMSGLPTETDEDLRLTFDLMDRMSETNEKTQHFGVFIYTPFPSPIVDLIGSEFTPPKSLEEWGKIDVFHFTPPWHTKKYVKKLETISAVTRYAFYPAARMKERGMPYRIAYRTMNKIAELRWKRRYFGMPIDLKVVDAFARRLRGYI